MQKQNKSLPKFAFALYLHNDITSDCISSTTGACDDDSPNTVFPVISAPGAFEIEMKHCHFQPAISAPSFSHVLIILYKT